MINSAKCPNCNNLITNIHFEKYEPSILKGGSASFVAIASPCCHVMGVVPISLEHKINSILEIANRQNQQIQSMQYQISNLESLIQRFSQTHK
jgi:hypothetical protein